LPSGLIHYHDRLRGDRAIDAGTLSDFVLLRSDGLPTYNFACVVDDAHMRITHVIRASEHLYNTARQVVLYDALGYRKPEFAHVSLILDEQRRKLSKREGQQSTAQVYVDEYRAQGYLPDALVNYLVLLGWSSPTGDEILDRERLVREFDLDRVSKSGAIFDVQKLRWMAGEYIRAVPPELLVQKALPSFRQAGMDVDAERVALYVRTFQTQVSCLAELPERVREVLDAGPPQGEAVGVLESPRAADVLEGVAAGLSGAGAGAADAAAYKQIVLETGRRAGVKGRDLFMPVRVALTGRLHGPDVGEIVALLGLDESLRRLRAGAALARATQD
jgi:nondiscriminating glutamyl-tRNA synthetase